MNSTRRGSIRVEDAAIVAVSRHAGDQHVLRLRAPRIAAAALPGSFVHLRCDDTLPMRRPFSILWADPPGGSIDVLFKVQGQGTARLARRAVGDAVNVLGPIGTPFKLEGYRRHALLIGGGVGIPPMVFLAGYLRQHAPRTQPLVLMGSEIPFPFVARPSRVLIDGMPAGVIATMPLLEDWGIACRLASQQDYAGCFSGYVTDLASRWIETRVAGGDTDIEMFACGPVAMLKAVAVLAARHGLPCEIAVEEYMACGVGGCAGCAIRVQTPAGEAMKRVCVDGPVFDARVVRFAD